MGSRADQQGVAEYAALTRALDDLEPACRGDWRFVLERHEVDDGGQTRMRGICRTRPAEPLCDSYARAAKPPAGMWAGNYYPARNGRNRKD